MTDNVRVWKRIEHNLEWRIKNLWIDRFFADPNNLKGIGSIAADRAESGLRSSAEGSANQTAQG